jgi:hypothetical protein
VASAFRVRVDVLPSMVRRERIRARADGRCAPAPMAEAPPRRCPTWMDPRRARPHDRRVKLRKPRVGDDYTTGSFRDGIIMVVIILAVITLIWLAYSWALNQPGVPAS